MSANQIYTLSKEEVAELIAAAAGLPKADVMQYFCQNPPILPRVNLAPMKSLMSAMKSLHGFNFSLNKNKSELAASLLQVVAQLPTTKLERLNNASQSAGQGAPMIAAVAASIPRVQNLALRPPPAVQNVQLAPPVAAAAPLAPNRSNMPNRAHTVPTSTVVRAAAIPPRPHFQQQAAPPQPAYTFPVHPNHLQFAAGYGVNPAVFANYPRQGGYSVVPPQQVHRQLLYPTNFNQSVYDEMKQLPGLHKFEIKDAMKMVPPNKTTFDTVLEKIIAKRQVRS